ncbi:GntR family transcriptional regulator [Micromonospora sp. Llam0]|uniref:GntR family transcriptional regulator n=1 Tax=Micromonospora sp. Llam0 TaxID=2485143 RepID=UPI000F490090|nr:GntR family transcriptional regulator [Micromonospora sp. Llam0]ROO61528.1 GntR family transcriptional regulator [Micromonospora sp. Llam0]
MALDPDDPRTPSQQIAAALRAEIKTGKFAPGEKLPSQNDLVERFSVARETIKAALRRLQDERLIVTRQGSGTFVRANTERPVGLRPHIERAFEATHVAIDFAGFSGETLYNAIQETLDKVRIGRLTPESIRIRILISDMNAPMAIPCRAEDRADDPRVRARSARITNRSIHAIVDAVQELADLDLVKVATTEVRVHGAAPLFKLFVINDEEAFFGFYPVVEHTVSVDGQPLAIYDAMGKDAVLFPFTPSDDDASHDGLYVQQAGAWFNSMWTTIAREYTS